MKKPTLDEIVFMNAVYEAEPTFAEKMHDAEISLPQMHRHTCAVSPLILTNPLFTIARGGGTVDRTWHRKGWGYLHYRGPTLTQSHQTVFLNLIKRRAGLTADLTICATPTELLNSIGWSDNARNQSRLIELFDDIKLASLTLWREGEDEKRFAVRTGLIWRWKAHSKSPWEFQLDPDIVGLFCGTLTFLQMNKRAQLHEGLSTFLYGYICANSCVLPFSYEELHSASGSTNSCIKDFAKCVRASLDQMQELGIITKYSALPGKVKITKLKTTAKRKTQKRSPNCTSSSNV